MLPISTESKYVEKILVTNEGQKCRVIFLVSLVGGRIQARIVSAEIIAEPKRAPTESVLSLIAPYFVPSYVGRTTFNFSVPSPYLKDFSFFVSQPTRAPAFV